MKKKTGYSVMVVSELRGFSGKNLFQGVLEEVSNVKDWQLDFVRPGQFFTEHELMNENGKFYDGYILTMPGTDSAMARLAASRKPTVLVNITDRRLSARTDAVASVWLDNADVGRCAAEHLLECGKYRTAGFVHKPEIPFYSVERMMAFRARMKRGGLATSVFPDAADAQECVDPDDFFNRLRAWLRDLPKPAAVMAACDNCAADVINACRAERIQVPTQVAVVGVDNDASQHTKCGMGISSVILNMRLMGRSSVRELDFLLCHPKWQGRPHEILIPTDKVFARESSAVPTASMRLVCAAKEFIAKNRMRRISPADVAKHLKCSRQLAELRFSQMGEATIKKTIEAARMEEAERLLESGIEGKDVAKTMHFTSANQFYRIYKRHFGHTIRQTGI